MQHRLLLIEYNERVCFKLIYFHKCFVFYTFSQVQRRLLEDQGREFSLRAELSDVRVNRDDTD